MTAGVVAAVGFLTRLPVPEEIAARGHRYATAYFPLVGAAVGGVGAAALAVAPDPWLGAALALGAMGLLTGGLHWDGWADTADAALARVDVAERRAILHDPRVGAHAVWATGVLLLLQAAALSRAPGWGVVTGAACGRLAMVLALALAPGLEGEGAGARVRAGARPLAATLAFLAVLAVAGAAGRDTARLAASASGGLAAGGLLAAVLVHRLSGLGGDACGAVGLLTETFFWIVAAGRTG